MKHIALGIASLMTLGLHAKTVQYRYENFKQAKTAESFLHFEMKSVKAGLFTTKFTGVVKKFSAAGDATDEVIQAGSLVEFEVKYLDTDVDGRNEKMWEHCLDFKNHPKIKVTFSDAIPLDGESHTIRSTLTIRGKTKNASFNVKAKKKNDAFVVDLVGQLSIKDLEIPDPSIVIAYVKDQIQVSGHLQIE